MSPYFESIRIQDRQIKLLSYHTVRLNRTRRDVFGLKDPIKLKIEIPSYIDDTLWKCRVNYAQDIQQVTFSPYAGRSIKSFKLIDVGADLDYTYKGDRTRLQALFNLRGNHDDIIIVRDGYLTDSFWSNILVYQGGRWYTPATPLLKGTMRQYLLDGGWVTERIIRKEDLNEYELIMPINALNAFDLSKAIKTSQIF